LQQPRVIRRIVFEVGILDKDERRLHVRQSGSNGRPFAAVARMAQDKHARIPGCPCGQPHRGVIGRAVVHGNDLGDQGLEEDLLEKPPHRGPFIATRDDDGQAGPCRLLLDRQ